MVLGLRGSDGFAARSIPTVPSIGPAVAQRKPEVGGSIPVVQGYQPQGG